MSKILTVLCIIAFHVSRFTSFTFHVSQVSRFTFHVSLLKMVDKHMLGDDADSCDIFANSVNTANSPQWDDDTKTRMIVLYLGNQRIGVETYLIRERNYEEICFKGVHEFIVAIREVWGNIPEKERKETHPKIVRVMNSLRILLAMASKFGVANNRLWGNAMRFAVQMGVDRLVQKDLKILDSGEANDEANDEADDNNHGETSPIDTRNIGEPSDDFDPLEEFYTTRASSTIDLVD